jgi:hypothetical protein
LRNAGILALEAAGKVEMEKMDYFPEDAVHGVVPKMEVLGERSLPGWRRSAVAWFAVSHAAYRCATSDQFKTSFLKINPCGRILIDLTKTSWRDEFFVEIVSAL